jgi:hypothetical protein
MMIETTIAAPIAAKLPLLLPLAAVCAAAHAVGNEFTTFVRARFGLFKRIRVVRLHGETMNPNANYRSLYIPSAICMSTFLLVLFFGFVGAYVALLLSLWVSVRTSTKPKIDWSKFKFHYHVSWALPLFCTVIFFIAAHPLKGSGLFDALSSVRFIDSAWDRVAEAMVSNDQAAADAYPTVYFYNNWRAFYPAAQLGLLVGSISYGLALSALARHQIVAVVATEGNELFRIIVSSLAFLVLLSIAVQLLEFLVLAEGRSFTSKASPFFALTIYWPVMLFAAVLSHALLNLKSIRHELLAR